jgi:hypothetical protein
MDLAGAINWAIGINGASSVPLDLDQPLARWYFIKPSALVSVIQYMRDKKWMKVDKHQEIAPQLTDEQWVEVRDHFGSDNIVFVDQMHNTYVRVWPCWAHQVRTLQPCLKAAFELINLDDIVDILRVQRLVADAAICHWWSTDYARVQIIMHNALQCLRKINSDAMAELMKAKKAKKA